MPPFYFACLTSWIYAFTNALHLLPVLVLACELCPKSVEATFYSFVMALINLGYIISYNLGGSLMRWLGIKQDDYSNIDILIIMASVYPLLTLPLMYLLLPS